MSVFSRTRSGFARVIRNPRAPIVGVVVAGLIAITGGAALATRSASESFADKAFAKLGGDSGEILDSIADKVVDKLTSKGGTLDSAQAQLVDQLAGMAGKKLGKVDPAKLISDIRGDVVAAGLGKLDGISVNQIVAQVTSALIDQAGALLDNVDVNKLATAAITDIIKSLNLEKLVKQKIDSIDAEKLVKEAVAEQMSGGGSSTDPLSMLLGGLLSGGR
jgi:hypothetical protein